MERIFAFATGNVWRWPKLDTIDTQIDLVRRLGFKAVELTLARKVSLYNFTLSAANLRWLRSLDYVSIHAPFALIRKAEHEAEVVKQLDCLERIFRQVHANDVVIHSSDVPPMRILKRYNMRFFVENCLRRSYIAHYQLDEVLSRDQELKICLDPAHAYSWSSTETRRIIKKFERRIGLVHICSNYRHQDNQPFSVASPAFRKSIDSLVELDTPFVIEIDIDPDKSMPWVRQEIKYIKSLFLNIRK